MDNRFQGSEGEEQPEEGEVSVKSAPGKSKKIDNDDGEYVDFEEVD